MPDRASVTFPRQLFSWFVRQQVIVTAVCLVALFGFMSLWVKALDLSEDGRSVARYAMFWSLLAATMVFFAVSVGMARKLMGPLGRLIAKTDALRQFPFEEESAAVLSLEYDEPGEWNDLERVVNEMARALRDKTIRLSREKTELRAIMSAMNETVLAVNREMRVLFFNPQMALKLFPSQSLSTDATLPELVRSPEILEAYRRCLETGRALQLEARLEPPGQGPFIVRISLAPLKKKHNQEIYGVVGVFHDISDLKKAEQVRIDFVGNVSHELRTPLTSIKGYLETAVQDISRGHPEQSLEFLAVVQRNVDRLQSLVNDLLDLSNLQGGEALKRRRVDLRKLTDSVLSQVDHRSHVVQTEFEVTELYADEARIEQLLRNLFQNAIRYVPPGGRIELRWQRADQGGIHLTVRDNGPGIEPEHLSRIFERFYRVDEARSRQVGGTGIGLSLVKHIMQRHNGTVEVRSEVGRGSEFICHFPADIQRVEHSSDTRS